jgi:hypothetical protein
MAGEARVEAAGESALSGLEKTTAELSNRIDVLGSRLVVLMGPSAPTLAAGKTKEAKPTTNIALRIRDIQENLSSFCSAIDIFLERLEF